ncbi:MAG: peptidoglycan DD-metalloendopeptidase family protein [Gammaproteobacteria bacterium]|nr:peptidoglycan DD-metalloendopeptidase family protein [Gammaproteobacteria bacterium]
MNLERLIEKHLHAFTPLFNPALTVDNTIYMELSSANNEFDSMTESQQDAAILQRIEDAGALAGVGGYLEDRALYKDTDLFQGDAERSIHIGVDVFMAAGTPILAPLDGSVHSFANRQVYGDYGPVIILRHCLEGVYFHTLYGHLSEDSLSGLADGKAIAAGQEIAQIGPRPINGNWAPHLHFQLIRDMQGIRGDYPGVVRPAELDFYRENCPDPGALLLT